jgi:hypothetical protein
MAAMDSLVGGGKHQFYGLARPMQSPASAKEACSATKLG